MNTDKIMKAGNARKVLLIYMEIAKTLSTVSQLAQVKIYKEPIKASNLLSDNGKKEQIVNVVEAFVIGVELLIDEINQVVQFYGITTSEKVCGAEIVSSVVSAVPDDWELVVVIDWRRGLWDVMKNRYPKLMIY